MSIASNLQSILEARYGRDVRQAIHDSIEEINIIAETATNTAQSSQDSARSYAQTTKTYEQQTRALRDEAEAYKDDAFSTTPEGYEAVVQKVNGLDVSVERGSSFIKTGTADGRCLINKIYGMSVQEGVPTPSVPVEIKDLDVKIRNIGKNLIYFPYTRHTEAEFPFIYKLNGITFNFQQDGSIILTGTATAEVAVNINTPYDWNYANDLRRNCTYYLSDGRKDNGVRHANGCLQMVLLSGDNERLWVGSTIDTGLDSLTVTDEIDAKYTKWGVRVVVQSGQTCNGVVIRPMVSFSDDTTYVKGLPMDNVKNMGIVLRALEVEADDNYNLVKDGKYYIADTLEETNERCQIVRRIGHKVFDGSENWSKADTEITDKYRKTIILSNIPSYAQLNTTLTATNKKGYIVSSAYPEAMTNNLLHPYKGAETIALHDTNHWIQIYDERYNSNDDMAEWKAHLAEEPLVVNYRLYKTEIEKISTTDAQIMYNLISEDGSTTLELASDIDTDMEVMIPTSIATGKSLNAYAQAKLNAVKLEELQTALLEMESV